MVERTTDGQIVEVLLPSEIPGAIRDLRDCGGRARSPSIEELDFFRTDLLRESIYAREGGRCFYCLRRLKPAGRCLDHVVARARAGDNSYRNVVACCLLCNSNKAPTTATDFLLWLYRERRLTSRELGPRLRALDGLAAGKLRPQLPEATKRLPRRGHFWLCVANRGAIKGERRSVRSQAPPLLRQRKSTTST
jgi:hypothetical protein